MTSPSSEYQELGQHQKSSRIPKIVGVVAACSAPVLFWAAGGITAQTKENVPVQQLDQEYQTGTLIRVITGEPGLCDQYNGRIGSIDAYHEHHVRPYEIHGFTLHQDDSIPCKFGAWEIQPVAQPTPTTSNCEDSYRAGCWRRAPFTDCCGICSAPQTNETCGWHYNHSCCDNFNGAFDIVNPQHNPNCISACNALKDPTNTRRDYCPGGKVERAVAHCDAARASYEASGARDWCNVPGGVMGCNWRYTFAIAHGDQQGSQSFSGSFSMGETPEEQHVCQIACDSFSGDGVMPTDFCPGSNLLALVVRCPGALAEADRMAQEHAALLESICTEPCGSSSTELADRGITHSAPLARAHKSESKVMPLIDVPDLGLGGASGWRIAQPLEPKALALEQIPSNKSFLPNLMPEWDDDRCQQAFDDNCWQQGGYCSCCSDCNEVHTAASCSWEWSALFDAPDGHRVHEELQGSFIIGSSASCFMACNYIKDNARSRHGFCPSYANTASCTYVSAGHLFLEFARPGSPHFCMAAQASIAAALNRESSTAGVPLKDVICTSSNPSGQAC